MKDNNRIKLVNVFSQEQDEKLSSFMQTLDKEKLLSITERKEFTACMKHQYFSFFSRVYTRTLIQEFEIYKHEQSGTLDSFVSCNNTVELKRIIQENFPELPKFVDRLIHQFELLVIKVLKRFKEDSAVISEQLFALKNMEIKITHISSVGDRHNNGQTTCMIETNCGKLVYKPRAAINDLFFVELLTVINYFEQTNNPYSFIDKTDYSWHKFIEKKAQEEVLVSDVKNFYFRYGKLIALCYTINASDMHYENIILMGSTPFIIDLEVLLLPEYRYDTDIPPMDVNAIGLLPRISVNEEGHYSDKSPLKSKDMDFHDKVAYFSDDDVTIKYKNVIENNQTLLPIINNKESCPYDFIEDVLAGFRETIHIVNENKDNIKSLFYRLEPNLSSRLVLRNTQTYVKFLSLSYHPDYFFKENTRSNLFKKIPAIDCFTNDVYKSEIEQLINGDVPFFRVGVNDKYIISSNSQNSDIAITGKDSFFEKLDNLSNTKHINYQQHLIRLSLSQLKLESNNRVHELIGKSDIPNILKSNNNFYPENIQWPQLSTKDTYVILQTVGENLFDGNTGIHYALELNEKLQVTNEQYTNELAILRKSQKISSDAFIKNIKETTVMLHGITGLGGYIWYLNRLNKLTSEPYYKSQLSQLCSQITPEILNTEEVDFVRGVTGTIAALLNSKTYDDNVIHEKLTKLYNLHLNNQDLSFSHGLSSLLYCSALFKNKTGIEIPGHEPLLNRVVDYILSEQKIPANGSWCKGILSRIKVALEDQENNTEVLALLNSTVLANELKVHVSDSSLCHGLNGANMIIGELQAHQNIQNISLQAVKYNDQEKFVTGNYKGLYSVGLFNGVTSEYLIKYAKEFNDYSSPLFLN
ncbi:type 2 lanthipeptide synthetase LanM [Psychrobium sp. 1_MG-2023]|uniref:type 2 lanthipeptide synthetase LanM n=1 Tax=Psychrobium sp. 1_MG-2023 TaxID=3062624 RepID=UPI000C32BF5A|nr:type 2 lanthipeptide synthetase LanM [Psychrobium sp. 1_MG-2023]MDP2562145.1 type 2 lanthipeptide synthetase LanM [Psychrobium sp. 1_MG-2023]PKF57180.1 hypothetical protein CW748_07270 [Alteromonadales bacterium alter-6D02]